MKKADDFRKAFGPATPGFESVVKKTIRELRAQETKPVVKEWRRWRRPVFAMAMVLVLFIGFVAVNGTINPFSRRDRIRSEEENLYTAQPITTVLSMGAGQEEGEGNGAESSTPEGEGTLAADADNTIQTILQDFFTDWVENPEWVIFDCTGTWGEYIDLKEQLTSILADRKPLSYQINSVSGEEGDAVRKVVCTAEMEPGQYEQFIISLIKDEYGIYRIDPEGLKERNAAEKDPLAEVISLSEDSIIMSRLETQFPGLSGKMLPVNLVSEKQGLRVEVVSGYVSGTECYFVISIEDLEGKYRECEVAPSYVSDIASYSSCSIIRLYDSKDENRIVRLFIPELNNPVTYKDRTISTGIESFRADPFKIVDLIPLLQQYGKTVEGVEQPELKRYLACLSLLRRRS